MGNPICFFIPPHLLGHIARVEAHDTLEPGPAQRTALVSQRLRDERRARRPDLAALVAVTPPLPNVGARTIYDDQHTWNLDVAPPVRNEGDGEVPQENANLAYDYLGATRDFYQQVLGRNSIDNQGMLLDGNVNFGVDFDNAFWDGQRMVFGNGDNVIFQDFTHDLDVAAHELTHGVTQHTAGLNYGNDQTGALNESFSDMFGTAVEAWYRKEEFDDHDFSIGRGVMAPQLFGEAIRDMAEPGTAYDNPVLGKDPQPRDMGGYVAGGDPHINSGIPNRWFWLVCREIGITDATRIMYQTLLNLWPTAVFSDAAQVAAFQARILARDKKVHPRAAQVVRGTAREQGMI
jgi:Zn-dependent metalloprotease